MRKHLIRIPFLLLFIFLTMLYTVVKTDPIIQVDHIINFNQAWSPSVTLPSGTGVFTFSYSTAGIGPYGYQFIFEFANGTNTTVNGPSASNSMTYSSSVPATLHCI